MENGQLVDFWNSVEHNNENACTLLQMAEEWEDFSEGLNPKDVDMIVYEACSIHLEALRQNKTGDLEFCKELKKTVHHKKSLAAYLGLEIWNDEWTKEDTDDAWDYFLASYFIEKGEKNG